MQVVHWYQCTLTIKLTATRATGYGDFTKGESSLGNHRYSLCNLTMVAALHRPRGSSDFKHEINDQNISSIRNINGSSLSVRLILDQINATDRLSITGRSGARRFKDDTGQLVILETSSIQFYIAGTERLIQRHRYTQRHRERHRSKIGLKAFIT